MRRCVRAEKAMAIVARKACRCRRQRHGRCAGAAGDSAMVASRWHSARVRRGRCNDGARAAVQWRCKARERRRGGVRVAEGGKTEDTSGGAGARKIYDMWTPRIFLSPVDPTLRVQTSVDCIGVVYQGLHQICI
jgi:hypothetical protein